MIFSDYPGHVLGLASLAAVALLLFAAYRAPGLRNLAALRWALGTVHAGAALALVLMIWNPSRALFAPEETRNGVLAVFDTSESMSVEDTGNGTRLDASVEAFRSHCRPEDAKGPAYRWHGFDAAPYETDGPSGLHRWGGRSDLQEAFRLLEVESRANNENDGKTVGAMVFTDGQADSKAPEAYPTLGKGFKVVIVGVGRTETRSDLVLEELDAPGRVPLDSAYTVRARVRARGHAPERATVDLLVDDLSVAQQAVEKTAIAAGVPLEFRVPAGALGEHRITARVSGAADESNRANNAAETVVSVVDDPVVRVLLFAQAATPDVGKVRQALTRDARTRLDFGLEVVLNPQGVEDAAVSGQTPLPADAEGFFAYDVVILGPCLFNSLAPVQVEGIYRFVSERGGGLVFLPGRDETDVTRARHRTWRVLLPMLRGAVAPLPHAGAVQTTPYAEAYRILGRDALGEFSGDGEPFLGGIETKPAALVLTRTPEEPLVLLHRVGRGRVAYVNIHGLQAWYREDRDGGLLARLLRGLTTHMSRSTERESRVELYAQRSEDDPYSVAFEAQVFDEAFQPVDDGTVLLTAADRVVRMSPAGSGRFRATLGEVRSDAVVAKVQAEANGVFLGERLVTAKVPLPRTEMDEVERDEAFLTALAKRVGGEYVRLEELPKETGGFEAMTKTNRIRDVRPIWPRWPVFLVLCAVLGATWFTRRRLGLV